MGSTMKHFIFLAIAVLSATPARAQLAGPNQVGVTMGHVHLAVKDVQAQKQFWISVMGGTLVKNGPLELIQFPGVFIMLRKTETPVEPPAGTIVNHFGFTVKDMPAALAKWKAANLKIDPTENPNEVYVNVPDGIRLEAFVAGLEAKGIKMDSPVRQVPNTQLKVAFLTDPFGTYIELTEGLAP